MKFRSSVASLENFGFLGVCRVEYATGLRDRFDPALNGWIRLELVVVCADNKHDFGSLKERSLSRMKAEFYCYAFGKYLPFRSSILPMVTREAKPYFASFSLRFWPLRAPTNRVSEP